MTSVWFRGSSLTISARLGLLAIALAVQVLCPPRSAAQTEGGSVIYVDRNRSGGNGASWDESFRTIRQALKAAGEGAQIWVANGTYNERVTLKSGVMLIGGFSGEETDVAQREPLVNRVVITSAGLDDVTSGTVIIKGVKNTRLDGVTVTGAVTSRSGGGVYCVNADGSNIISGCTISGNRPLFGTSAGIYCRNSSLGVLTCVILENQGGGVVCEDGSSPTLMGCTLRGNAINGLVCGKNCSPKVVNTIFSDHAGAGVLALSPGAQPELMHNLFDGNGTPMITGVGKRLPDVDTINMTVAKSYGNVEGDPKFGSGSTSYHLHDGSAALDRGLLAAALSVDLDGDERPGDNGKLDIGADEAPSEFDPANNDRKPPVSEVRGLAAAAVATTLDVPWIASDASSGVSKVMLYYRRNNGSWKQYGATYKASPIPVGGSAIGSDGLYDFYTRAIDKAGNTEAAPAVPDASVQLYRAFQGGRLYVKPAGSGAKTGENWQNALTLDRALQVATAVPADVQEIWVAKGTYTPTATGSDRRNASIRLISGVTLYGGFKGDETTLTQRKFKSNVTTFSGDLNGDDASGRLSDNSRHVVDASGTAASAVLDGVTIRSGYADGTGDAAHGAGVFIRGGKATLRNCTITGNRTADRADWQTPTLASAGGGAGVSITSGSQPRLVSCVVIGNRTGHGGWVKVGNNSWVGNGGNGAGISCIASQVTLTGCEVTSNATGYGGTVYGMGIQGHGGHGAGIYCETGDVTTTNCLIARNTTGAGGVSNANGDVYLGGHGGSGAGFYGVAAKASLSGSTITANVTGAGAGGKTGGWGGFGAGLRFENTNSTLLLERCLVAKNTTGSGGSARFNPGYGGGGGGLSVARALATVTASQITSNTTGAGGRDLEKAARADGGQGGGILASTSTLNVERTILTGNRTGKGSTNYYYGGAGGNGAGLAGIATDGLLTNCFIAGNTAGNGGDGLASPEDPQVASAGTGGRGGSGGGVYLAASPISIRFCSIAYNAAGQGGNKSAGRRRVEGPDGLGGGLVNVTTTPPTTKVTDTILWGNREFASQGEAAQLQGAVSLTYSCVEGWTGALGGAGNLGADPQFANPATLDLHLRAGSPCLDTGARVMGVNIDIDGGARPYDGDGRGANHGGDGRDFDIGADEFHGSRRGPTVSVIAPRDANPTSASTVRFTVTFNEPVKNVGQSDFSLAVSGLSSYSIQSLSGSGAGYTVTVATGSGNGSLGLSLKESGTGIVSTSGSLALRAGVLGPVYLVDRTRPQVTIVTPDPRFDTETTWPNIKLKGTASDADSGVARVMVRKDGGAWIRANSATQWSLSVRLHQYLNRFEVQSFDRAGNASPVMKLDYDYNGIGAGSDILSCLLGFIPSAPGMDRNGDGKIDIADLLKARQTGN